MSTGIVVAAVITTLAAVALYGYLILRLSSPGTRTSLLVAALAALPLQPLAFYFVRVPLDAALRTALGTGDLYSWATTFLRAADRRAGEMAAAGDPAGLDNSHAQQRRAAGARHRAGLRRW